MEQACSGAGPEEVPVFTVNARISLSPFPLQAPLQEPRGFWKRKPALK